MKRIHKEVIRDKKLRLDYLKNELKLTFFKALLNNRFLDKNIRTLIYIKNKKMNNSIVKFKNRCVLTGRGRGIIRSFRLSRIVFKNLVSKGLIIGIKKTN